VKVLRVMAPLLEVAPMKTVTRREERLVEIMELDCWMWERDHSAFSRVSVCGTPALLDIGKTCYIYASASCIEGTRFQF
jgi:hypothetical protein